MEAFTARQVYDPTETQVIGPFAVRPRALVRFYVDYYRAPLAWFGLLVTLLVVAYAGGAVMFILHAGVLGELGPAISPVEHWVLDSTLGFVGLAPVVALIAPLAVGVPTYVLLMWASLTLVQAALRHRSTVLAAQAVLDPGRPVFDATPAE